MNPSQSPKNRAPKNPAFLRAFAKGAVVAALFASPFALAAGKPPGYAVASAHPLATQAGLDVLAEGGNAFDAAVAVTAALAVVEPYSSGIGGGGFWLLHRGKDGFETVVDGRETAPAAATETMYQDAQGHAIADLSRNGPVAGGIPGEPAALDWIASHYGKLGLARDLAPAIKIAEEGFAIDSRLAQFTAISKDRLSPAARAVFMPDGQPPAEGTHIKQPDLAVTLKAMAGQGAKGFYSGEVAQKLVDGVRAGQGIWTADDLAHYKIAERKPISFKFDGYRVTSAPPPTAGGIGLAEILQQLQALHWTGNDGLRSQQQVIESMRRAYRDRAAYLGDPAYVQIPQQTLLSPAYAAKLAATFTPDKATPSASLQNPDARASSDKHAAHEGDETSHFSILDADGNRVAATITVNLLFGSGYMAPGTGVIVNDEMDDFAASTTDSNAFGLIGSTANAVAPGKRPLSSMCPTFVEGPRGLLILGDPGGSRIITMVVLGVLNFVHGADALAIASAPRYHMQYLPDVVEYEPDAFNAEALAKLSAMGYTMKVTNRPYGNMQVVEWPRGGNKLQAAADPRGVGTAVSVVTH